MELNLEPKNIIIVCFILYILYILMNKSKSKSKSKSEKFTAEEMKKYPQMLQTNCVKSKEIARKLQNINAARCDPNYKGRTQRDTINNKRLCYDDIHKEIVASLDAESNCVMAARVNSVERSALTPQNATKQVPMISKLIVSPKSSSIKSVEPIIKVSKSVSSGKSGSATKLGSVASAYSVSSQTKTSLRDQISRSQSQNLKPDEGPDYINQFFIPAYDSKRAAAYSSFTLDVPFGVAHKYRSTGPTSYDDISRLSDPGFMYQLAGYKKIKEFDGLEYKGSKQK
jgi:hypothetical protein